MSTLNSALTSAVTGLFSQSTAISTISANLSNSGTVGYKDAGVSFATLVTGASTTQSSHYTGSGVYSNVTQAVDQQGVPTDSSKSTHLAIQGSGFFAVSDTANGGDFYFTRVGNFYPDANGILVNENGYYLQGYPTDANGAPTVGTGSTSTLEPIDLGSIGGNASATENLSLQANIPAEANIGDAFTTDMEIFDSLGTSHNVTATWTKTAANVWDVTYSDPVLSSDASVTTGTLTGSTTVTFDSDGNYVSSSSSTVNISGWTTGASASTIETDYSNLTQFAHNSDVTKIVVDDYDQDGIEYGEISAITVGDDGIVTATFDNGVSYAIYQVPIATFANPNGLALQSGNVYSATNDSGNYTLNTAGESGAGEVLGSKLESSTVDTADELTKLIVAQQAYSACAEIISTTDDMFDTLISAAR